MQTSKVKLRNRKTEKSTADLRSSRIPVKIKESRKHMVLEDLFEDNLYKIYHSEIKYQQIIPLLAKASNSENLKNEFNDYTIQAEHQLGRLEKIFDRLELTGSKIESCKPMEGMISECNEIMNDYEKGMVKDAALIIAVQKIQHYGIAVYGSLRELADVLSYSKVADVLERTLEEKKNNDKMLSRIAEDVNEDAFEMVDEDEGDILI